MYTGMETNGPPNCLKRVNHFECQNFTLVVRWLTFIENKSYARGQRTASEDGPAP